MGRLLLRTTRKTGEVLSAPPEGPTGSFLHWRRVFAPFALLFLAMAGLSSSAAAQETGFQITSPAPPAADICNSSSTVTCTAYSFTFTTNASSSDNVTWSLGSGSLPQGINLGSKSGILSGNITNTSQTTTGFFISASDSSTESYTSSPFYTFTVNSQPAITATVLPVGAVGHAYPATILTATGGTLPYTWSVVNNTLPAGFALSSGGVLSASSNPTAAGTFSVTIKMTDSAGSSGNGATSVIATIPLTVLPALTVTSSPTLVPAEVSVPYSFTFTASGGTPPYSWSLNSGSRLPTGLILSPSGVLNGIPTAASSGFSFGVTVSDSGSGNTAQAASQTETLVVNPLPTVVTTSLPSGMVGGSYFAVISAQGGSTPYFWTVTTGSLPSGLTLNTNTGAITGTPVGPAGTATFIIRLFDAAAQGADQSLSILINPAALSITTTTLPSGTVGAAYSASIAAQGGTPPYTNWSLSSGSLPLGLTLNATTGAITGTPTTAGSSQFTAKVTDSGNPAQTATQSLSLAIAPSTLTLTATALPNGAVGSAYSAQINAQGGTAPYASWTASSGSLPGGLALNPANGIISGTPTTTGTSTFSIKLTDSGSPAQTASQTFTITVFAGVTITTTVLPSGTQGLTYSATLTAQSGTGPYTWSITTGALPTGLVLNAQTGVISGMPTANGTFTFTVKVTDSNTPTAESATQLLSLFINPPDTNPVLPTFTLSGIPATPAPGTNITNGTVVLSQPSSAAYSGTLTVILLPNEANLPAGYLGDAGFVDSSGNKSSTVTLLVPALSSSVPLPTLDPGTVSGTLTVSLTVAGQVVATSSLTVAASAPVIEANSVQIVNVTSGGFEVELVATSTTRQLNLATFTFTAATGSQISGTATFNVDVNSLLAGWYSSSSGLTYGGAFSLTIPFTLSGSASAIQSVSVTLTNSVGTSAAVSGTQ